MTNKKMDNIMTHYQVWHAIELFARSQGLSCSSLAKRSGLDPSTFNKSKRFTKHNRPRWPSTSSIAKIISATGVKSQDFFRFLVIDEPDSKNIK